MNLKKHKAKSLVNDHIHDLEEVHQPTQFESDIQNSWRIIIQKVRSNMTLKKVTVTNEQGINTSWWDLIFINQKVYTLWM